MYHCWHCSTLMLDSFIQQNLYTPDTLANCKALRNLKHCVHLYRYCIRIVQWNPFRDYPWGITCFPNLCTSHYVTYMDTLMFTVLGASFTIIYSLGVDICINVHLDQCKQANISADMHVLYSDVHALTMSMSKSFVCFFVFLLSARPIILYNTRVVIHSLNIRIIKVCYYSNWHRFTSRSKV